MEESSSVRVLESKMDTMIGEFKSFQENVGKRVETQGLSIVQIQTQIVNFENVLKEINQFKWYIIFTVTSALIGGVVTILFKYFSRIAH